MKNNWEHELFPFVQDAVFSGKYLQFTIDFAQQEVAKEAINNEQMCALSYRIDNALQVLNPCLKDYYWFMDLKKFVDEITSKYLAEERFMHSTLKLMSGD